MNVKTVKRFSKRTVSTLLSLLMVISLFTVCMVGTATTTSAYDYSDDKTLATGTIIRVKPLNGAAETWTNIYFYYEKGGITQVYKMTPVDTTNDYYELNISNGTGHNRFFFFADRLAGSPNNKGGDHWEYDNWGNKDIETVWTYGGLTDTQRTEKYVFSVGGRATYLLETKSDHDARNNKNNVTDNNTYALVDATLYNYRNQTQIAENSDFANGQADNPYSNIVYSRYNTAVADWYRKAYNSGGITFKYDGETISIQKDNTRTNPTPLYQGNFRVRSDNSNDGNINSLGDTDLGTTHYVRDSVGLKNLYYNFVSVANGTNRLDSATYGSSSAAALNLVDAELDENGNITQGGVELPQFSKAFEKYYNSKNRSLAYSFDESQTVSWGSDNDKVIFGKYNMYTTVQSNKTKNLGNIQSSYENLKFPFNKNTDKAGNTVYTYQGYIDKNRYYSGSGTNFSLGNGVKGYAYNDGNGGAETEKQGYYPFNSTNPSTKSDVVNCFGTRFDIEFNMTEDGTLNGEDLMFEFVGDDDVWVYIDGYLALDMGGSHNACVGTLNLNSNKCTYIARSGYYNGTYDAIGTSKQYYSGVSYTDASSASELQFSPDLIESLQNTSKTHTLSVFYLERGTFDSNFVMSYMLPVVENKLTLSHDVDCSTVNEGLRLETMSVANNDVFDVALGTQHMSAGVNNTQKLPIAENFTRNAPSKTIADRDDALTPKGAYADLSKKTDLLQQKEIGSDTVNNSASGDSGYTLVSAYYHWIDSSVQLDEKGAETTVKSATNSGVGIPGEYGHIPLLYDQSAVFYNQFPNKVTTSTPLVAFQLMEQMKKFGTDNSSINGGILEVKAHDGNNSAVDENGNKLDPARNHSDYYTATVNLSGGQDKTGQQEITLRGGGEYYITGTDTKIEYNHVIKTGKLTLSKVLNEGVPDTDVSDPNNKQITSYGFLVEYRNLFGNRNTTWKVANKWTATRSRMAGAGASPDENMNYDENGSITGVDGIIYLLAGDTVTFEGIPVDTQIRVTELETINATNITLTAHVSKIEYDDTKQKWIVDNATTGAGHYEDDVKDTETWTSYIENPNLEDNTQAESDSNPKKYPNSAMVNRAGSHSTSLDVGGMEYLEKYGYTYYNSYTKVPILYRYKDRDVINGKPTVMQRGYTYFAHTVPSAYSQYIKKVTVGGDEQYNIKDSAKSEINEMSPQIINVLKTYTLDPSRTDYEGTQFVLAKVEVVDGKYKLTDPVTNTVLELEGTDSDSDGVADDVCLRTAMEAVAEEGFYHIEGDDETNYVILAEYGMKTRKYTVTVDYIDKNDTSKYSTKSWDCVFNGMEYLKNHITGYTVGNEYYKITTPYGKAYFAYWEREVNYRDGDDLITTYIPVSTNFDYMYRVTDDVHIRAVYRDAVPDTNDSSKYYRYVPGVAKDDRTELFVNYDYYGKTWSADYTSSSSSVAMVRYWMLPAGKTEESDRLYATSPDGPYNISYDDRETAWVPDPNAPSTPGSGGGADEDGEMVKGYCVPNADEHNGFAVSATDRLYNSWTKEVKHTETVGEETVTTYSQENRTYVDIVFGAVGGYDNDTADGSKITEVGYVLFQNQGGYADTSKFTGTSTKASNKTALEYIIDTYSVKIDNKVNDLSADGKVTWAVNGTNNGTGSTCLVGKFNVVPGVHGDGLDGNGTAYNPDGSTATGTAYQELGKGKVNLTNKNRLDIVMDFVNNENSRKYYYTCYTYMYRVNEDGGKTLYVSPTPSTFNFNEADPTVKNPEGKRAYVINNKSYLCDADGNTLTDSSGNPLRATGYGWVKTNSTVAIDGRMITFDVQSGNSVWSEADVQDSSNNIIIQNGKKYKGELVKVVLGNKTPKTVKTDTSFTHTFSESNDVNTTDGRFDVFSYFKLGLLGATYTVPDYSEGINVKIWIDNVEQTFERGTILTIPDGKSIKIEVELKPGYEWGTGTTNFSDSSTTKKSIEVTPDTSQSDPDVYLRDTQIGTWPTATPKNYELTITATGCTVTATIDGNPVTISNNKIAFTGADVGKTVEFNTTVSSGYTDGTATWTTATADVSDNHKATYVLTAENKTVTVTYTKPSITLYFDDSGVITAYANASTTNSGNTNTAAAYNYLKNNAGRWSVRYNDDSHWVAMTAITVGSKTYYTATIPSDVSGIQIVKMNTEGATGWNNAYVPGGKIQSTWTTGLSTYGTSIKLTSNTLQNSSNNPPEGFILKLSSYTGS